MISIIVPVYNVEKYLPKCIESLISQTYKDIEIILVDDGSPDNCGNICDDYKLKDNRIKVIHQPNSGVSAARNRALDIAVGDYLAFCDSDDYLDIHTYEEVQKAFDEQNSDVVIYGYDYVAENGTINRPYAEQNQNEIIKKDVLLSRYFDMPPTIRLGVCNKVFKRELFTNVKFPVGIKGAEDGKVLFQILKKCQKAVFIHKGLYKNCERVGSATRGGLKADTVLPALDIYKEGYDYLKTEYPDLTNHAQAYYLDSCLLNYVIHCKGKGEKEITSQIRKRVRSECFSALFNNEIKFTTRVFYILFALNLK